MSETAKPDTTGAPVEDATMKDEATTAPATTTTSTGTAEDEDRATVLKQVEFYLSDSNLPYDKFMWTLHTKVDDHWIPIATLMGFKRMREYGTKYGLEWVAEVLRGSEDLLEVDESGENVRRAIELKPPGMTQYDNSAYAKGFPDETPDLQQRIEKFFEGYAPIAGVRFRRTDKRDGKKFKNSVFVEFKDKAGLETFLKAEPRPTFEGKELLIMSKDSYVTMKAKEKGFDIPDKSQILVGNIRRGFNAFKLMADEAKSGKTNIKSSEKAAAAEDADDEDGDEDGPTIDMDGRKYTVKSDGTIDESKLDYTKGKVLKYTGAGEGEVEFKAIKDALQSLGKVYVTKDYDGKEFSNGFAAFDKVLTPEDIETVKQKVPEIAGSDVTWASPSDEDERRFWLNRVNFFAKRKLEQTKDGDGKSSTAGRGRGRGRGGRGGRGAARGGRGGGRGGSRAANGGGPRGEKRKRDENADSSSSAPKTAPPVVGSSSAAKKVKLDDGSAA